MLATAEAFKPYEIARANGFTGEGYYLRKALQSVSGLPGIELSLNRREPDRHRFVVLSGREGNREILSLNFTVADGGVLNRFLTVGSFEPDKIPVMTVSTRGIVSETDPYYDVDYLPTNDQPTKARMVSVALSGFKPSGYGFSVQTHIATFGPNRGSKELFKAFQGRTNLPIETDLLETLRMYLAGQFMEGGQMIPLTPETLARRIIMASG